MLDGLLWINAVPTPHSTPGMEEYWLVVGGVDRFGVAVGPPEAHFIGCCF